MLVLSRKPGERIVIDDRIRLTVIEVRGNRNFVSASKPRRKFRLSGMNCLVAGWRRLEWTYDDREACPKGFPASDRRLVGKELG